MNERLNPYTHTPAGAPTHPLPSGRPNAPPICTLCTPPACAPTYAPRVCPPCGRPPIRYPAYAASYAGHPP